jgi:ABC-type nitrate/sulfonate/bicarbonate transport system ATPase subunit/ABC-type transporter Mla maintaining outer membrane lipid asymmetry permease subunit MlaE
VGDSHKHMKQPSLDIKGLKILLPSGEALLTDFSMRLMPGEVAVLLGGSGAGKSTFARVLFEPEALAQEGFAVSATSLQFLQDQLGLVPQRGALFDHLSVCGNIDVALRYAPKQTKKAPAGEWLARVGLDPRLAESGASVDTLSGGQAQRVAVARALAGGRALLFLDEPSVGLDPYRVRMLAKLIREQCLAHQVAAIVVTHDVSLAVDVADALYLLDTGTKKFEALFANDWKGPPTESRGEWLVRLEEELSTRIQRSESSAPKRPGKPRSRLAPLLRQRAIGLVAPFSVAAKALLSSLAQLSTQPRDFAAISGRVLLQTLLRPLLFYLIVAVLIGYTILYVVSKVGGQEIPADRLIWQIGGSYIVALAPVLSALLFVAASGSATNAWLGSIGLTKQALAMRALGVSPQRYLYAPSWVAVGLSYLFVVALFAFGMLLGGLILCQQLQVPNAYELLTADFFDPRPDRAKYLGRAYFLAWVYAWGIASDVIAKGSSEKRVADDVTRGMTQSVVACTLWVVLWELGSAVIIFSE